MLDVEIKQLLDRNDVRGSSTFPYHIAIQKPYGQLDLVLSWCRSHYKVGTWGWLPITMPSSDFPGQYNFFFDEEPNAFEFALRWVDG